MWKTTKKKTENIIRFQYYMFSGLYQVFDNVRWDRLWNILTEMKIAGHLIRRLYHDTLGHNRKHREEVTKRNTSCARKKSRLCQNFRFVVDTTFLVSSPEEISNLLKKFKVESTQFGPKNNYYKTKTIVINCQKQFPGTRIIARCELAFSKIYIGALVNNTDSFKNSNQNSRDIITGMIGSLP